MATQNTYEWGIWLKNRKEWAVLSPRLCKPSPHNSNLVPAMVDEMWKHINNGDEPELRRIPKHELKEMRHDHSK